MKKSKHDQGLCVSVLQETLKHGLSTISRAVSSKTSLPVLSNILIAIDEGRLRLSATNLELGITCWIAARIEQEGSTTVPARTLADLINTLPGEQVLLSLDANTQTLNVRGGSSTNDIKCIDAQEFPPLPVPDMEGAVQLNVADFREMIQQVAFAASADEARPVLMGVLLQVDKDKLIMAAADGFRLSVRKATLSQPAPAPLSAIIPARCLVELARVASDGEAPLNMVMPKGRGQVVFRVKDVEVTSQLIDGTFPDYQQIIPRKYNSRTLVSTASLLKACKQAEVFAREGSSNLICLSVQKDGMEVTGASEEVGSAKITLETTQEGDGLEAAFNGALLRQVMEVAKTPNVALEMTKPDSPCVVRQVGDGDFTYVLMPMHHG